MPPIFSHATDPDRLATLEEELDDKAAVVRVLHVDASGRDRRKSFRKESKYPSMALSSARSSALRFLFKEGFLVRAPQDGALRWLTATYEPYPHGFPYALDRRRGQIWVADTGALRRITPGSGERAELSIGDGVMPRHITWGGDRGFALLDLEGEATTGNPPWRAPSKGSLAYGLVAIHPDATMENLIRVPWTPDSDIVDRLSATEGDELLGPHPDGVALYTADGTALAAFPAARTKHNPPKAAVSPDGQRIVVTADDGALRFIGRMSGEVALTEAGFSQVHELELDDDGVAWVRGFAYPSWGLYRITPDGERGQVSESVYAERSPDGRSVVEADHERITWRRLDPSDAEGEVLAEAEMPWLGMSRHGRPRFLSDHEVVIRTDTHTLGGVDLRQLGEG